MIKDDFFTITPEDAHFCVVDVETTGLSAQSNNIIEIGIVRVENLKVVDKYHSYINPGRLIPPYITQLTGISNEDVYDAPYFADIVDDISEFISDGIIAAHNISFDNSFLRKEYTCCGRDTLDNPKLCTLKIARRMYPMLKSKSLGSVIKHLHIRNSAAHTALGDAQATARALIKMIKELREVHSINNVGELLNFQYVPKSRSLETKVKKSLSQDIAALPDAPGVYSFLNSRNEVIYIGKAKSLKKRVQSYFLPTAPRKAKKIVKQASHLKIEITNSELTALLTEAEAIKLIDPKHNTMLKRYGNKYFLRITKTHNFPTIEITNTFDFDGNDYFGLFISRKKAEAIFDMLQRTFAIRECVEKEYEKEKRCFLAEIERCTAPCDNKDALTYNSELEKVYEFLYGKNQFALNRLLNKMKEYSAKEKFEKAAGVKELVDMILSQTHKTSLLAEPVNSANVLFEVNDKFSRDYVLMISGKIFIKKYSLNDKDYFEDALDDYFSETLNTQMLPDDEDLEKMKITLNWLVKNRNKVRAFYLKDYQNKQQLFKQLTNFGYQDNTPVESTFDIRNFIPD